jgi:hypothetical protein
LVLLRLIVRSLRLRTLALMLRWLLHVRLGARLLIVHIMRDLLIVGLMLLRRELLGHRQWLWLVQNLVSLNRVLIIVVLIVADRLFVLLKVLSEPRCSTDALALRWDRLLVVVHLLAPLLLPFWLVWVILALEPVHRWLTL